MKLLSIFRNLSELSHLTIFPYLHCFKVKFKNHLLKNECLPRQEVWLKWQKSQSAVPSRKEHKTPFREVTSSPELPITKSTRLIYTARCFLGSQHGHGDTDGHTHTLQDVRTSPAGLELTARFRTCLCPGSAPQARRRLPVLARLRAARVRSSTQRRAAEEPGFLGARGSEQRGTARSPPARTRAGRKRPTAQGLGRGRPRPAPAGP
jgi:hypothetical protein